MPISHTKEYGIYHWDTFDNVTLLVAETDTLAQAEAKVKKKYGDRIRSNGADQVEIVDSNGNICGRFNVG